MYIKKIIGKLNMKHFYYQKNNKEFEKLEKYIKNI